MNPENKQNNNHKKLILGIVAIFLATATYFLIREKSKSNALPVSEKLSENKNIIQESESEKLKHDQNQKAPPKKPKLPIKIKYRLPGKYRLPVKIKYQEASFFGTGNILVVDNTSNQNISVSLEYFKSKTQGSKSFKIELKPGQNAVGPVFYSGDKIVIASPEYENYEIDVK